MCFWLNQQLLRVILLLNWWRSNAGSPRIFKTNTATNWNDWINCLTIKQVSLGGFFRLKPHQNWLGKIGCFWLEGKLTMYNVKISDFGLFLGHTNFCDWINPHLFGGLLECLGYLLVYVDWFIDTQTTISILGLLVSDMFFNRNKFDLLMRDDWEQVVFSRERWERWTQVPILTYFELPTPKPREFQTWAP